MTTHDRASRSLPLLPLLATLALLSACDDPSTFDLVDGAVEDRDGPGDGGPVFNTNVLEGTDVPAIDTQGGAIGGVRLVDLDVEIGGVLVDMEVSRLWVDHGTLKGSVGFGGWKIPRVGADFIGSKWTFLVGGQHVVAELVDVEESLAAGLWDPLWTSSLRKLDPDRLVYTFRYEDEGDQNVMTCAEDSDAGARMVIYGGILVDEETGVVSSRANTVYFGCISGAVGKAALWGYAPDSPSLPSLSLDAFTTAIRSVRADYCNDGSSYTLAGNLVTLRDRWNINDHPPIPFATEAIWEEGGGAACLNRIRRTGEILSAPHVCPDGSVIPLCPAEAALQDEWTNQEFGEIWTKIP